MREKTIELANIMSFLADSLRDLDEILKLPTCNDCDKLGGCEYTPEWGHLTRFNCPLWDGEKNRQTRLERRKCNATRIGD